MKLWRNYLRSVSGQALAQLITLIGIFPIARLYSPEDFAQYALVTVIISVLLVLSRLRLELAIPLARSIGMTRAVMNWCIRSVLALTLLGLGISVGVGVLLPDSTLYGAAADKMGAVAVLKFFTQAVVLTLSFYWVRCQSFSLLATLAVVQAAMAVVLKVALGFYVNPTGQTLLLADGLSYVIPMVMGLRRLGGRRLALVTKEKTRLPEVLASFKNIVQWRTLIALVEVAKTRGILVALEICLGLTGVGQFVFAQRISTVPVMGFSAASNVLYSAGARHGVNSIEKPVRLIILAALILGGCLSGLFLAKGEYIFELCFSAKWAEAGKIVHLFFLGQAWVFASCGLTRLPELLGVQKKAFFIELAAFAGLVLAIVFAYRSGAGLGSYVTFYASAIALINIGWLFILLKSAGFRLIILFYGAILYAVSTASIFWILGGVFDYFQNS